MRQPAPRLSPEAGASPKAPGESRGTVVVLHGFKGFEGWGFLPALAEHVAARGFRTISFSAGHCGVEGDGRTFERPDLFESGSWSAYLDDLGAILDAVEAGRLPGVEPDPAVHLVGHSMGGGISVLAADRDPRVRTVTLLAAVSTPVRFSEADRRLWREAGRIAIPNQRTGQTLALGLEFLDDLERNREKLDIEAAARRLEQPALVVHGEDDETVPVDEGHALAKWIEAATLETVAGASHTFGEAHPYRGPGEAFRAVLDRVASFLEAEARAR